MPGAARILAIHAHPDDVEFLCAGTLALLRGADCHLRIATMTPGDCGSAEHDCETISEIRRGEARASAALIGANVFCLEFRDLAIFNDDESRRVLEALRRTLITRAGRLMIASDGPHSDHHFIEEINPMRRTLAFLNLAGALAFMGLVTAANRDADGARADQESGPVKTERGGWLVTTPRHRFEVFFYKTGLRIFPSSDSGTAVTISKLTGSAALALPGAPTPLVYPLKGGQPMRGREPESLDLAADLSWVPVGETKVQLTIEGLADPSEPRVSFTVPFELVRPRMAVRGSETAAPPSSAAPSPSAPLYTYQSGYYGYGYYPAASPATPATTAPAAIQYQYSVAPAREVPIERPYFSPRTYDTYAPTYYGSGFDPNTQPG